MADVRPFRPLRPRDDLAGRVIAPPYDVLTEAQARAIAQNRDSFVRVTRSEVDLPEGTDPHGDAAYAMARTNLDAFRSSGRLVLDDQPTYVLYGQTMGSHTQVGVIGACSVAEYDDGRIAKHEFTRPDKEDDRMHHMEVLDAQVGLVFLAHPPSAALAAIVARITASPPAWEVTTDDGVIHRTWRAPQAEIAGIQEAFAAIPRLYVADGHHRSAAASRVHAKRKDGVSSHFVAGLYPSDRLQILAYNRVVHDLNGRTPEGFLAELGRRWSVEAGVSDTPSRRGDVRMRLGDRWYKLELKPEHRSTDPVGRLDCSAVQDHLLGPILGIDDPRRSTRISFLGGIHGPAGLEREVAAIAAQGGTGVAFHLFPTGLDQLFEVADAGEVMPPKSTWFEPKLREGVVVRLLS